MFFSTIVLRKIKTRQPLKKACACISYYLALIPPCINATISIRKNQQYDFPKMRGGGRRPFGFFPKYCLIWQRHPSLSPKFYQLLWLPLHVCNVLVCNLCSAHIFVCNVYTVFVCDLYIVLVCNVCTYICVQCMLLNYLPCFVMRVG